jgi:L-alanine-DL-glutamate epimerase-like enolase superfamily enzyme
VRITNVRLTELTGYLEHPGEFWEERLSRPVDIYPEQYTAGPTWTPREPDGRYRVVSHFLHLDTDEGVSGLGGPITWDQAALIGREFAPLLIGQDPRAHERIWDTLYRFAVHGRKGVSMLALSAVDCALWDLKGRWLETPVYRLLGGPTRDSYPCYASALGFSLEPERVRERARELHAQGFRAQKWFFRHGPGAGREGMRKNLELVRTLRETLGDDVDLMLDCWMSWSVPYAVEMAEQLAEYRPRWLEEPVLPDLIESCARIRRAIRIPVSTGEHEYTRWGIKLLLDAGAADLIQADTYWAGGITEMQKIIALCSACDVPVVPHGHSVPANVQLTAAQPPAAVPLVEYLVKWNAIHQHFFKQPVLPVNGAITPPDRPGLGVDLDEGKIVSQRELRWDS